MKAINCLFRYFGIVLIICFLNFSAKSQPDWNVDASNFEYNMNVIGVGFIECDEIIDEMDQIAAFVGDEIRGTQYFNVGSNKRKFVYMFIYSNKFSGDTIHFKIYDASKDSIYELRSNIIFSENAILGSENSPIEFTTTSQALQIEPASNLLLRQANVGDAITKILVKNVNGEELNARLEWVQDEVGRDNHYFEIVGQDLYIKERIVNFPKNEIQIHIRVKVEGSCEKTQKILFNISDLTKSKDELDQIKIEIYPNPVIDYFLVKSNVTFDHVYLLDPIRGYLEEVQIQRPHVVTKTSKGLSYLIFKKGTKIWKKPIMIISRT